MLIMSRTLWRTNSRVRQISREEEGENLRPGLETRRLLCSQDVFCDARQTCGACQKLLEPQEHTWTPSLASTKWRRNLPAFVVPIESTGLHFGEAMSAKNGYVQLQP